MNEMRKLLSEAREILNGIRNTDILLAGGSIDIVDRIDAALAEPEQEPVAWIQSNHLANARKAAFLCRVEPNQREGFVPLYTKPEAK